ESFSKVEFENEQIRVSRRACAPHQPCDLSPGTSTPGLLVALTPIEMTPTDGAPSSLEVGGTEWLTAGAKRMVENAAVTPAEVLQLRRLCDRMEARRLRLGQVDRRAAHERSAGRRNGARGRASVTPAPYHGRLRSLERSAGGLGVGGAGVQVTRMVALFVLTA